MSQYYEVDEIRDKLMTLSWAALEDVAKSLELFRMNNDYTGITAEFLNNWAEMDVEADSAAEQDEEKEKP
jgi:hypothetical protein